MRQKELRIALVCYGGISLAVYMHGVTKELWHLARASRAVHAGDAPPGPLPGVYAGLLRRIEDSAGLRIRVLPDILTGASAGGINAVFLAQAIHSGQSLEPLTRLWLEGADTDRLIAPEARPWSRFAKLWALPFAWWLLARPDSAISQSVAPETRAEVRRKVSQLVRCRWFAPPFSGAAFSGMVFDALAAMRSSERGAPLLPPGHPLDLWVTATDFRGHREVLRLNSPPMVEEREHRLTIGFSAPCPAHAGAGLAPPHELTFAARATASFPGAFPPLMLPEIDALPGEWPGRAAFLQRIMPQRAEQGTIEEVALIDGSVLVNAPFASAIARFGSRPAQREVDRRLVYIDPRPPVAPTLASPAGAPPDRPVGFFAAILGSLSGIPREQPVRDDLEQLAAQSRQARELVAMVEALRPDVEHAVERLFGHTFFLDRPTPSRLAAWRRKAQQAAAEQAGYAYHSYAQAKLTGILHRIARLLLAAAPRVADGDEAVLVERLRGALAEEGLERLAAPGGGATAPAIAFMRAHDQAFRVRRLRLIARRLSLDWQGESGCAPEAMDAARDAVYSALSLYFDRDDPARLGPGLAALAALAMEEPLAVLDELAARQSLEAADDRAEAMLSSALEDMEKPLRRRVLMAYLGFPYYDIATLPLLRNEGLTEFDPVKVDRISPEDARTIRTGGAEATLRGIELFNFGGFFSRAYRENDYLWGRLHGADRVIDLVASSAGDALDAATVLGLKREAFLAICSEEQERGLCAPHRIAKLLAEITARLG